MFKAQAIILAGGQGSRMKPYTSVLPKPLLPVGEIPIAEIIIRQLSAQNIKNIVISVGHLGGLIEAYFGNGKALGVTIKYLREKKPLGTAGAIKLLKSMDDNCLVMNGDILTDVSVKELMSYHKENRGIATVAIKERVVKTDFGVVKFDSDCMLCDYIEKPEHKSYVSTGINVLNKKCKKYILENETLGIPELMLRMRDRGEKISCFKMKATWLDLGRLDDFELSQEIFKKYRKKFIPK